ncbi:MAG: helix-turn-helix domain-containing protein [Xanthomonadaceae bacterium]|nr:helix-turn-helix domain-containing protein [Xanthomonadaceae bacterium]
MKSDSPFYPHCFALLNRSPLFSNLDDETINKILLAFSLETWRKKSPVMDSQLSLERFYVIIAGRMRVSRINYDTGRELTVALLGPGDVFDIICLLDYRKHEVLVTAIDDLETIYASNDHVRSWIRQHPELNKTFLPYLGEQMRALEELATDVSLHDTLTRLARLILRHTNPEHNHELQLIHDLSDEELAKMIGSVRAVVNRHMQNFKKEGIVETHRNHLAVKDLHGLLNMIDEHPGLR